MQSESGVIPGDYSFNLPTEFSVLAYHAPNSSLLEVVDGLCSEMWLNGDGSLPKALVSRPELRQAYALELLNSRRFCRSLNCRLVDTPLGEVEWLDVEDCAEGELWAIGARDEAGFRADMSGWLTRARNVAGAFGRGGSAVWRGAKR